MRRGSFVVNVIKGLRHVGLRHAGLRHVGLGITCINGSVYYYACKQCVVFVIRVYE